MPRAVALAIAVAVGLVAAAGCSKGGSEEAFCEQMRSTATVDQLIDRFDADDPAGTATVFAEAHDKLADLADAAPDEVGADVRQLADMVGELADGLAEVQADDPAGAIAVLDSVSSDAADLEQAGDRVARYAADRCGIDLDDGGVTTTTPTATTAPTTPTTTG